MDFNKILKGDGEKQELRPAQSAAWILNAALGMYCLIQAAVFSNFCAVWMKVYLLPGNSIWILNSLTLLMGSCIAVWIYGAPRDNLKAETTTALAGKKEFAILLFGVFCAELLLISERNGIRAADVDLSDCPLPELVRTEWNILFFLLYLSGIFVNIAGTLAYLRKKTAAVFMWCLKSGSQKAEKTGEKEKRKWYHDAQLVWIAQLLLIYGMAVSFSSSFCAMCYYRAMNIQILLPVMLICQIGLRKVLFCKHDASVFGV